MRKDTILNFTSIIGLYLFGHVARMKDDRVLKMVAFGMVEGCRPGGRPPRSWIDDITEWCEMDLCEVIRVAIDRENNVEEPRRPSGHRMKKKKEEDYTTCVKLCRG